jgi:hypothetical protein
MYKGVVCGSNDLNPVLEDVNKENGIIKFVVANKYYVYIIYELPTLRREI